MLKNPLNPTLPQAGGGPVQWGNLNSTGLALACARAAAQAPGPTLVITADSQEALALERDLAALATAKLPVKHIPDWETLPYDLFSPHPDIISDRIYTLFNLGRSREVIVVPVSTLLQRLAPKTYIQGSGLLLKGGDRLDLEKQRALLAEVGYRCVPQVSDRGEFAIRGALLDLFPMGASQPYRIELFDDEVESIRTFDPETQLSTGKVEDISLLPAREYPFDDEAIDQFRGRFRERFDGDLRHCTVYQDARRGTPSSGIEYYLPLFFDHCDTLFDYLPSNCWFVVTDGAREAADAYWEQLDERYQQRRHDIERPILSPKEIFLPPEECWEQLGRYSQVHISSAESIYQLEQPPRVDLHDDDQARAAFKAFQDEFSGRILLAADSPGRRELIADQFASWGLRPEVVGDFDGFAKQSQSALAIMGTPLENGFVIPGLAVFSERQFAAGRVRHHSPSRAARDPAAIIRDLTDLNPGSPVVHEDYGVGRYLGLTRLDAGGLDAEFVLIEYADSDKLYVPVSSLHLISRYTGGSTEQAPLHRLGGDQWEKAKRKAAEKAHDVAAELLEIYARREARKGRAMVLDKSTYYQFTAGFPFEETTDQAAAIQAVVSDLASDRPMDRVVCGDVGFGKTEVALRAAFVAAHCGHQVAVLVPTTLLAQQHYKNFLDRFADWPLRVEVVSRFNSNAQNKSILDDVAAGKVDIVIGTHRLLQKDIQFKDLGLLIIDEEQRFGVRQKERLKKLRAEVDLLTLTATPIPRTLNMALSGLRDLSIIATPPAQRVAVKTFSSQWDSALLKETVQRELQRGGQVYFLHNEVETIQKMTRELEEMLPAATIRFAHGQMPERELEQVMLDFHRQRFNLLVCTTIIENGIDIPTANTIIVNRADRFGLSQLHQLRGRVGRSHHRAFAYLITPHKKAMTTDAIKRLEALESLEELGSGFTLATHDLEIRGAGELLGDDQSGQIQEIGFSLYSELLERAVAALKSGELPEDYLPPSKAVDIDLQAPALIPDDYLPDVHTRLVLYKRIASARDIRELDQLKVEMIDRFGLLTQQIKNLFAATELKFDALNLGIKEISVGSSGGRMKFADNPKIEPLNLIKLVQSKPNIYSFEGAQCLRFKADLEEPDQRIDMIKRLIQNLTTRNAA